MEVLIYVLCYDSESEKLAKERFGGISWMKILFIPTTFYLESILYGEILSDLENEWISADYVGTVSYSCIDKGVSVYTIKKAFTEAAKQQYLPDVVAFYGETKSDMLNITNLLHPNFITIWNKLLDKLELVGYKKVIDQKQIKGFFCNYWAAKPEWMQRYISFFRKARILMDYNQPIRNEIWKNSNYPLKLTEYELMRIYGKPYYPYIPFICERLPCYYFENEDATILINSIVDWNINNNIISPKTEKSINFEVIDFSEINWPAIKK